MDSVKTIMSNSNKLLEKALKLDGCIEVSFKAASLLEEQNKLNALFSSTYSDVELMKQKETCLNAYIHLEYSLLPYDEECKKNYYARCDVSDLYTKCRIAVRKMSVSNTGNELSSFISQCYKPVCDLRKVATESTEKVDTDQLKMLKEKFSTFIGVA